MTDSGALSRALSRALDFLVSHRPASGELPVAVRVVREAGAPTPDSTIFATALAVPALETVADPRAAALVRAGAAFLAGERLPGGLWRFWPRTHSRHREIPPDLDDSCCAGVVVSRLGLARPASARLLLAHRTADGRFLTWLFPRRRRPLAVSLALRGERDFRDPGHRFWLETEAAADDVDAGVNANALLLLGDRPETAAAARWLVGLIERGAEEGSDKWHARTWSVRYLVARAAAAGVTALAPALPVLAARASAEACALAERGDAVDLSLAAVVALRAAAPSAPPTRTAPVRALLERLLDLQQADGSWPAAAIWFGGPRRAVEWGSPELTSVFAAEALALALR